MGGYANNAPIVTDGLVFYVDAGNGLSYPGSGTTWSDLIGGNDGTLINGATYSATNGGSLVFDGVDDYVSAGTASNFMPTNDMTIDAWIKIDAYDLAICMSPNSYGGNEALFYIANVTNSIWTAKKLTCDFNDSGLWPASNTDIPLSTWTHVCLVRDGATVRFYYNGSADGTGTSGTGTLSYASGQPLYIGTDVDGTGFSKGNWLDGEIAAVKIYDRALSSSEVLQNYNALKNRFL